MHAFKSGFVDNSRIHICAESVTKIEFARIFRVGQIVVERFMRNGFSFYSIALCVQICGDLLFAYAFVVLFKDIAHNICFFFIKDYVLYIFTLLAGNGLQLQLVAVNNVTSAESAVCNAGIETIADSLRKTFAVFLGIPFKEHFIKFAAFVFGNRL